MNSFWRCILAVGLFFFSPFTGPARAQATGGSAELISPAARESYRSQFRYLKNAVHGMDLKGPPVLTDGLTNNIAEAEWPFLT